jgi:hypothetical protein
LKHKAAHRGHALASTALCGQSRISLSKNVRMHAAAVFHTCEPTSRRDMCFAAESLRQLTPAGDQHNCLALQPPSRWPAS